MQHSRFPRKIALHLKKVCYKVSLYEYHQQHSCKAFTSLTICAKVVRRKRLQLGENSAETDQPPSKTRLSINIRS